MNATRPIALAGSEADLGQSSIQRPLVGRKDGDGSTLPLPARVLRLRATMLAAIPRAAVGEPANFLDLHPHGCGMRINFPPSPRKSGEREQARSTTNPS